MDERPSSLSSARTHAITPTSHIPFSHPHTHTSPSSSKLGGVPVPAQLSALRSTVSREVTYVIVASPLGSSFFGGYL